MKLKNFLGQFPNPLALRVSGMGGYTSKCEKKSKSLHPNIQYGFLHVILSRPKLTSVPDPDPNPDPPDPHVFGPPGSGSTSQSYGSGSGSGSGSFYHHAKIVRKTLIRTLL